MGWAICWPYCLWSTLVLFLQPPILEWFCMEFSFACFFLSESTPLLRKSRRDFCYCIWFWICTLQLRRVVVLTPSLYDLWACEGGSSLTTLEAKRVEHGASHLSQLRAWNQLSSSKPNSDFFSSFFELWTWGCSLENHVPHLVLACKICQISKLPLNLVN